MQKLSYTASEMEINSTNKDGLWTLREVTLVQLREWIELEDSANVQESLQADVVEEVEQILAENIASSVLFGISYRLGCRKRAIHL